MSFAFGVVIGSNYCAGSHVVLGFVEKGGLRKGADYLKVIRKLFICILVRRIHLSSHRSRIFKCPLVHICGLFESGYSNSKRSFPVTSVPGVVTLESHLVLKRSPNQQVSALSVLKGNMWWKLIDRGSSVKVTDLLLVMRRLRG